MSSSVRTIATSLGAAIVLVTIVWLVARATGDDLRVKAPGQDAHEKMMIFLPAFATLTAGLVGALIAWLLRRRPNGRTIFLALVVIVLIFEGIQAFVATESNGTAIWLNLMHVLAAAVIVPAYLRLFSRSV